MSKKEIVLIVLPLTEERSGRKRQAMRYANAATDQLALATRRTVVELQEILDQARAADEAARRELDAISASDAAALATDAMARSVATVRNAMPLLIRSRLAHALLKEAVRRFKERSQAPMLKSASSYFAQITGGEFDGLFNDDSQAKPVILDDVLMGSDDRRASCIFKALAEFSASGQAIVFTHHQQFCDVAGLSVLEEKLAVVELLK